MRPAPTEAARQPLATIETAVLDVLAGVPLGHAADRFQLEATTLADAIETYQRAGRHALELHGARDWCQLFIEFADWPRAEQTATEHLLPLLRNAEAETTITAWWFIRKHPCWRLRLRTSPGRDLTSVDRALDELAREGRIRRWWYGIYEPETAAFGGATGMATAHELFCADSQATLSTFSEDRCRLGRRELSVLLCTVLFRSAGLEWYEQGDAWHRVAQDRPAPADVPSDRLRSLADTLGHLMSANTAPDGPLLAETGPLTFATDWADAFRHAGQALGASSRTGKLQRGLRQVLAYHVIFHWNRLGLPLRTQSILATAAHTAILAL
ncbi:thiopeptide-type bacteriocin biosynthesis protein [Actinomadura nitritigenes]|uniref:Thiopeptide-type bacteriocin biosynthesis protein n=1 Tax=Actinomadura nitritigenes TaxID=134602 RepID=A0ABS3R1Y9_9ACTN|nr:thiopeptide-type bacteriocin biosynthesis protein [Actinomadura nitritigenes]MBO2440268.1 thiopeptide-type bacteriocin biosynthesis protein [Actinomadura nitritigenes]